MSPVSVVHVLRAARVGGAELQLLALLRHLDPSRVRSTVAILEPGGPLDGEFARAAEVWMPRKSGMARLVELTRHLASGQPDVVHTWLARLWGTAAASWLGLPVLASYRGIDDGEHPLKVQLKRAIDTAVRARISVVAAPNSEAVAQFVTGYSGIPRRHTVVVENIFDREELLRLPPERPATPFTIAVIARLEPVKDHATLLRAVARLGAHLDRPVRLLVAGDGSQTGPLRALAVELGIADRCEFLGRVSDLAAVLGRAHVTALTSISEGAPNALIESLAAGVPVVSTATAGAREVVVDGDNGLTAPVGDVRAVAAALERFARDEALRQSCGARGRARIVTRHAPRRIARRYERLYAALAKSRHSRTRALVGRISLR